MPLILLPLILLRYAAMPLCHTITLLFFICCYAIIDYYRCYAAYYYADIRYFAAATLFFAADAAALMLPFTPVCAVCYAYTDSLPLMPRFAAIHVAATLMLLSLLFRFDAARHYATLLMLIAAATLRHAAAAILPPCYAIRRRYYATIIFHTLTPDASR